MTSKQTHLFIGSYTSDNPVGIRAYLFDEATAQLELLSETGQPNASYLAKHPGKQILYGVAESSAEKAKVFAYSIEAGQLHLLNKQAAHGDGPCHVAVHPSAQAVATANYGSGSVVLYPLLQDGQLAEASSIIQHEGQGQHPSRQKQAHAHQVVFDASGKTLFACDLGTNKVMMYDINSKAMSLSTSEPAYVALHDGAGPRHMLFHPNGKDAFVLNELDSSLSHFGYSSGRLELIKTHSTLNEPSSRDNFPAALRLHPNGNYLYSSNRGHDSIAQFSLANGSLELERLRSTEGEWPRDFCFSPSGNYLFVANQFSNSLVVFRVDGATGHVADVVLSLDVPAPVCVCV